MARIPRLLVLLGIIALVYEVVAMVVQKQRAQRYYEMAVQQANTLGRPLVVIGDPHASLKNRLFGVDYDHGDICIDLRGCDFAPQSTRVLAGDVVDQLSRIPSDSVVVFESCVLPYVPDKASALYEMHRVAGGTRNVFSVGIVFGRFASLCAMYQRVFRVWW